MKLFRGACVLLVVGVPLAIAFALHKRVRPTYYPYIIGGLIGALLAPLVRLRLFRVS